MKIVLNEIIDQLYEAVKKCDIDSVGVQPVMRCLGRLKGSYSESLLLEAMAWIAFTLHKRLIALEKKLREKEERRYEAD
jgi:hypothetical protein